MELNGKVMSSGSWMCVEVADRGRDSLRQMAIWKGYQSREKASRSGFLEGLGTLFINIG